MIFGKHINRYYLKHAPYLLLGVITLIVIDYLQLLIPNLYKMVVNGINTGVVQMENGEILPFNMDFLLDEFLQWSLDASFGGSASSERV